MARKQLVLLHRVKTLGKLGLRVGQRKFFQYGLVAVLVALCTGILPLVGENAFANIVRDRVLSVSTIQSVPPALSSGHEAPNTKLHSIVVDGKAGGAGEAGGEKVSSWNATRYNSTAQGLLSLASETQTLEEQARTLYEGGRFSEAVTALQQVLQKYQASGDILGEAVVNSNLALNYQQLGRYQEATEAITTALKQVQQVKNSPEQLAIWAQSLDVQASLQLTQGKPEAAADSWEQAIALYNQLGDTNRATLSRLNQVQALQALGLYRRAISTLENVAKTWGEQPNSLAKVVNLRSLGDALLVVGDFPQAEIKLNESLRIAQTLNSPDAIAATYLSLGNLARAEGNLKASQNQPQPAQQKWEAALGFYTSAAGASATPQTQTQAQLNLFRLLVELGRVQDAQALYPQVQRQITNLPPGRSTIYAQVNFVRSLMALQSRNQQPFAPTSSSVPPEDIAQMLTVAYEQAEQLADSRAQAFVLGNWGHLYELQQQWSEAQTLTRRSLALSQSLIAPDIDYRFSWQLGRILKAQGQYQEAIAAYTQAYTTSRSLRSDLSATNPDVQFSFKETVEPVYRQLIDLLLHFPEPSQENLKQAREVFEALQVARLDNFLQLVCREPKLLVDEVIDSKDPTAAIIYPVILKDRLEVMLRLPKQKDLYHYPPIQLSSQEIEAILNRLYSNLGQDGTYEEVQDDAHTVYNWLIEPVKERLAQSHIKTLIFVLDGSLRKIPMAALYDGQHYLAENYTISLIPGLPIRDPIPLRRGQMKVLAASLTDPPKSVSGFSRLENVKKEIKEIKETGVFMTEISEQKFTISNFNQKLNSSSYDIVHLATHGQFGADRDNTFVLTAEGRLNIADFEQLFRTQRRSSERAIQLLVLSACQTATGNDQEILGLAGTTVQAGASSAIASLWDLDDEAGVLFTKAFYQYLGQPDISRAEALRRAQMVLLQNDNYSHPRYWTPYILVGSWL